VDYQAQRTEKQMHEKKTKYIVQKDISELTEKENEQVFGAHYYKSVFLHRFYNTFKGGFEPSL